MERCRPFGWRDFVPCILWGRDAWSVRSNQEAGQMFESVIERRGVRSGRFGTGAWVSIGVHAGLLGLVFFISGRVPETVEQPFVPVVIHATAIRQGVKQAAQPKPATAAP